MHSYSSMHHESEQEDRKKPCIIANHGFFHMSAGELSAHSFTACQLYAFRQENILQSLKELTITQPVSII